MNAAQPVRFANSISACVQSRTCETLPANDSTSGSHIVWIESTTSTSGDVALERVEHRAQVRLGKDEQRRRSRRRAARAASSARPTPRRRRKPRARRVARQRRRRAAAAASTCPRRAARRAARGCPARCRRRAARRTRAMPVRRRAIRASSIAESGSGPLGAQRRAARALRRPWPAWRPARPRTCSTPRTRAAPEPARRLEPAGRTVMDRLGLRHPAIFAQRSATCLAFRILPW